MISNNNNYDYIDLKKVFNLLILKKKLILVFTTVTTIISFIEILSLNNIYKANVTILPQNNNNSNISNLTNLAAFAGIDLKSSNSNYETFYSEIIKSNYILDKLIKKKWKDHKLNIEVYLHNFLEFKYDSNEYKAYEIATENLMNYLREDIIFLNTSKENGVMYLSVFLPNDPEMSADIANWLVNELHIFNEKLNQRKGKESLDFINKQLNLAKLDLDSAENNLSNFLKLNRSYEQSIDLALQYKKLTRDIESENIIYTELRKQNEIANLEYNKAKETITVLDYARANFKKHGPNRILLLSVSTFFSFIFICVYVLFKYNNFL